MSGNTYVVGAVARVSVTIADINGAAGDPGALRLKVKSPAGVVTTYSYAAAQITRDGTGAYHADVTLAAAGTWAYRWETDPPNGGAVEGTLSVLRSVVI